MSLGDLKPLRARLLVLRKAGRTPDIAHNSGDIYNMYSPLGIRILRIVIET